MKRVIISILATVCIMSMIGVGMIYHITTMHDSEIAKIKSDYESLISKLDAEFEKELTYSEELEEQIFNIMNGNEYEAMFKYDDVWYTYKGELEETIFGLTTLNTMTIKSYY